MLICNLWHSNWCSLFIVAFGALTLLIVWQDGHAACKNSLQRFCLRVHAPNKLK